MNQLAKVTLAALSLLAVAFLACLAGCVSGEFCKAKYGLDAFGCTCGECAAKRLQAVEKRMEEER